MQIAIDGPAGAGKSTIAKRLAHDLDAIYVDTGAMYRTIAWKALEQKVNLEDETALAYLAEHTDICFADYGQTVFCDGKNITQEIRMPEINRSVPVVAQYPQVRHIMVAMQQRMAQNQSVVMDGRDIGEVVLPQAEWKFFVTASVEERAQRRVQEWQQKGIAVNFSQVLQEIRERDAKDASRTEGALKQLPEAIVLDTTALSIEEAVCAMKEIIGGHSIHAV